MFKKIFSQIPFIFDFETKQIYYKANFLHINRYLAYIINSQKYKLNSYQDVDFLRIGRLTRKKLKLSRENLLQGSI
jgi:hypothetical protein